MTLIAQSCRRRPWVWGGGAGDLALGRPASFGVLGEVSPVARQWRRRREEIDSIKHLSRTTTWFYIALYAFIVHDRRLVRVARARPAGGRVPSRRR